MCYNRFGVQTAGSLRWRGRPGENRRTLCRCGKSPTRTPALLAANRANAQKSTGPRTPGGKNRVALSALRHGVHAPDFLSALGKSSRALQEFSALYRALYAALLPDKTQKSSPRRWAPR